MAVVTAAVVVAMRRAPGRLDVVVPRPLLLQRCAQVHAGSENPEQQESAGDGAENNACDSAARQDNSVGRHGRRGDRDCRDCLSWQDASDAVQNRGGWLEAA